MLAGCPLARSNSFVCYLAFEMPHKFSKILWTIFSKIHSSICYSTSPVTTLLGSTNQSNNQLTWNKEQRNLFREIKQKLVDASNLNFISSMSRLYHLDTDTSNVTMVAHYIKGCTCYVVSAPEGYLLAHLDTCYVDTHVCLISGVTINSRRYTIGELLNIQRSIINTYHCCFLLSQ